MLGTRSWVAALLLAVLTLAPYGQVLAEKGGVEVPAASKTGRTDPEDARASSKKTQEYLVAAYEAAQAKDFETALAQVALLEGDKKVNNYERAKALQIRSQIAADRGDMRQAAQYLEQAVALDILPNVEHFQAMLIIAQIYAAEQEYQTSIQWFDRWERDANIVSGRHWATQAQNYYYLDDFEKTVEIINKAFATGDEPHETWAQLKANSLYELERYDEAAEFAREQKLRFVDNEKLRSQFLGMEAGAYVEADDYEQALEVLEDAKAQGWIANEVQWKQLYQLYFEDEQYAKASGVIEEGMAAGALPRTASLLSDLGDAYYLQDNLPKALESFGEAAAMSTDDGHADLQRGHILLDQEKDKEAEAAVRAALDKGNLKQEGTAWYLLCLSQYNQGKGGAAREACVKAQGFDESRANADQLLKMMGR
ncbi:MAG: tetratricopeptide repeat protein [Xanthomonadales bacterium]|nr:tetratricopeptide repeat protein [Xanthomonadales bacterium]